MEATFSRVKVMIGPLGKPFVTVDGKHSPVLSLVAGEVAKGRCTRQGHMDGSTTYHTEHLTVTIQSDLDFQYSLACEYVVQVRAGFFDR